MVIEGLHENTGKWVVLATALGATEDEARDDIANLQPGLGTTTLFGTRVNLTRFAALRINSVDLA